MGVPAGIQNALFSISHMLTQSSIVTVNNMTVSTASAFQEPSFEAVRNIRNISRFA